MQGAQAIIVGVALGIVGSLPSVVLFERALRRKGAVSVAAGLVSILVSFAVLSAGIIAARLAAQELVLPFGVAEAVSFLLVWVIEAVRAWRDAQRGASPRERK